MIIIALMIANDRDVSVFKNIGGPKIPSTVLRCKPQNNAPVRRSLQTKDNFFYLPCSES
jgi:hypothetical protein